jgi:hypothetical protein
MNSVSAERLVAWIKNFDLSDPTDEAIVTKRLEEILSDLYDAALDLKTVNEIN